MTNNVRQALFFPLASEVGREKQNFLESHRVICPDWDDTPFFYRTSWENIQRLILTTKAREVEEMRQSKQGSESADEYERLSVTHPLEVFSDAMVNHVLPQLPINWNPQHGIDLDVFLVADDEEKLRFIVEVIPRFDHDPTQGRFASEIKMEAPYVERADVDDDSIQTLATLILSDRVVQDGENEYKVLYEWDRFVGCWRVRTDRIISLLLNQALFSVMELGNEGKSTVVIAQTAQKFDGEKVSAQLRFTTSKPS